MSDDLTKIDAETILNTAMVKDYLRREEIYILIRYFMDKNDFDSKCKLLELKALDLVHAILTPSAMHEFVVTDLMTEFAVECAKRKRIHLADSLITAANHYLSELMDGHESFFLDTEEPMWPHSSFLGIALAWNKVAECNDRSESGEKYHIKADEVYRDRIERYFGDKYESLYKASNYDTVKWGKW